MKAVIDTNVLVEGLTRLGTCGAIVDAWASGRFVPCVSTALALEYEAVLTRGRTSRNRKTARMALQALFKRAVFVPILFSYRPQSPDPGDDMIVDCVMNAGAGVVTSNTRDFRVAAQRLGFALMSPREFMARIEEEG
ncbi:MAG: PIN domain-containing protein [Deltaproteobacteria bacterium]|nr:PIN domain-containing protein [Deltaproteobacteria bacterium]